MGSTSLTIFQDPELIPSIGLSIRQSRRYTNEEVHQLQQQINESSGA